MIDLSEIDDFGTLLRLLLARAGKTQSQLAQHLDVRRPTVSDWVRGEHLPQYRDLVIKAAQFLEASEEENQQLLAAALMSRYPNSRADHRPLPVSPDIAAIDRFKREYLERVAEFAQTLPLAWGKNSNIDQAYIHARLEPLERATWPPSVQSVSEKSGEGVLLADSLLSKERVHGAILAPAGSGKSTLWHW